MATIIRVTCPSCNDIKISSLDVTLRTCAGRPGGEYRWRCKCGIVVKQADERVVQILRNAMVDEEIFEAPLELIEHPVGGTLEADDIIDFKLAMQDGSLYEKITTKP